MSAVGNSERRKGDGVHIVIMGCGRVGSSIARRLEQLGHSVAIIDHNPAAFRRLGPDFKGAQVTGVGFDPQTLTTAGIERAGAFAAVSSGDNSNIIAARVAREMFGVGHVVARIYDAKRAAVYERLGIPTVAVVPWAADRLLRTLLGDRHAEEWRDPSGHVALLQVPVHEGWVGRLLTELETATGARAACVIRFGEAQIPSPSTVIQSGDQLYMLVTDAIVQSTVDIAGSAPEGGH